MWMEIESTTERGIVSYFLFTVAEDRKACSDTCHQNLEDAFHQAEYACGVRRDEWNQYHD